MAPAVMDKPKAVDIGGETGKELGQKAGEVATADVSIEADGTTETTGAGTELGQSSAQAKSGAAKRKKKKNKKKTGAATGAAVSYRCIPEQDNSRYRLLGNWPAVSETIQTEVPSVAIHEVYGGGPYAEGEILEYGGDGGIRSSDAEKRELERLQDLDYQNIRRAAEVHRQVRKYVQSFIKVGMPFMEIVDRLESKTSELVAASGLDCGWGFPTGVSVNNCAAHWTPNPGDDKVALQENDIVKIDFGVHVAGRIIDSAWTLAFNPRYDPLIQSTQEATNAGIKAAGIDVRLTDVGEEIEEVIKSFEVELDGKSFPVRPIRNLNGHSILPYMIHGGKSVPIVKNGDQTRMEEGEVYAIETFASTGKGIVVNGDDCSHYMKNTDFSHVPLRVKGAKQLLGCIEQNFSTLPFCRRWLDGLGQTRHLLALKNLVDNSAIVAYPPLIDSKGSYTSQMEHTILLRPTCKEIVSRGYDY